MKKEFIQEQVWELTFGGAFQRAYIYQNNPADKEKRHFRNKLKGYVENLAEAYTSSKLITEKTHLENISSISEFTKSFSKILSNGKLNFGVSQKVLNLYLKFQWCLGNIPKPPHFPVDRIIQVKLKCSPIIPWTKITTAKEYMSVINHAKTKLNEEYKSLPELELALFNRRNNE